MLHILGLLLTINAFAGTDELPQATIEEPENYQDLPITPERHAKWCHEPRVTVCRGSGLDLDTVSDAFDFIGQEFRSIERGKCECDIRQGEIQFGANKCFDFKESKDHGRTVTAFVGECILGVVAGVETKEPIVITHEAGHSIGWMHSSAPYHLMFPFYDGAGWLMFGMEE
jgi:hypothetical protein